MAATAASTAAFTAPAVVQSTSETLSGPPMTMVPSMTSVEEIPAAAAFLAGHAHASYRRAGGSRETILPDFLIGAHAAVTNRPLLTRDARRVATYIPGATIIAPDSPNA